MNCPFHVGIYKEGYHSYRDLPIRYAELGTVYRWVCPCRAELLRMHGMCCMCHGVGAVTLRACHSIQGEVLVR